MNPYIAGVAIFALLFRAWSRNSLTPLGLIVAGTTALVHAIHPWSVFFTLLGVFFLAGTFVTKVKHDIKSKLTHSSSGSPGGEGPRTHIQVLANSLVASILILAHAHTLRRGTNEFCWRKGAFPRTGDVLVSGIVANYAAVAADTFSSELGILAKSRPRLITAPWKTVAPGTNGGVTAAGIYAGFLGSVIISLTATFMLPFCPLSTMDMQGTLAKGITSVGWTFGEKMRFMLAMTAIGTSGSLLDSILGALFQASVIDVRSGKVVEGEGGGKVLVHGAGAQRQKQDGNVVAEKPGHASGSDADHVSEVRNRKSAANASGKTQSFSASEAYQQSRRIETGRDLLSNNAVNLLMAGLTSAVAVLGTAWLWDVPLQSALG